MGLTSSKKYFLVSGKKKLNRVRIKSLVERERRLTIHMAR